MTIDIVGIWLESELAMGTELVRADEKIPARSLAVASKEEVKYTGFHEPLPYIDIK